MVVRAPDLFDALRGFCLGTFRALLGDIERTPGGRRRYRPADVEWLGLVRCLRETGMPIADLKEYSLLAEDPSTLRERLALLERHDAKVQADIDRLRAQQDRLREKIDWYRGQLRRPSEP